jgi:uncharacterized protein involved in exopolysaccharide biosynthesis
MEKNDSNKTTHEIDIIALVVDVLKEWKTLLKFGILAGVIGIVVALCVKKTYTATVILAPETSSGSSKLGNLAGLATTFGANLGGLSSLGASEDAITPLIYPNLFASMDFLIPLREIEVLEQGTDTVTTYERHVFGEKVGKQPLIARMKSKLLGGQSNSEASLQSGYILTDAEKQMYHYLYKNVGCICDKKTDIVTISVKDHDPLVAAIVVDTVQSRLQQYIIDYRTKKARTDLLYFEKLLESARAEYESARQEYAAFSESHKGVTQTSFKVTEDYLQSEMEQKYSILTQVQLQVHSCVAKVQESTPAFAVIQKSYVPLKASGMSRSQIVVMVGFLGLLIGVILVTFRLLFSKKPRNQ